MGVSKNSGVPYFGVFIIRILLFRVLYFCVPYFRKLPNDSEGIHRNRVQEPLSYE